MLLCGYNISARSFAHAHIPGDQRQPAPARDHTLRLAVNSQMFRSQVKIARVSRKLERIFLQPQPFEARISPIIIAHGR
jgi:hypothetical protein